MFLEKFVMTSEPNCNFAYVTLEPIQMNPGEAFTILKAKLMTPALQAKSALLINWVATLLKTLSTSRRQI
jgi:hypothetical protein